MIRISSFLIFALAFCSPVMIKAQSSPLLSHHFLSNRVASSIALRPEIVKQKEGLFWISGPISRSRSKLILDHGDNPIVTLPTITRSPYDSSTSYDTTSFYRPQSQRLAFIASFSSKELLPGIWSLGIDTGHKALKLSIQPSLYFGWAWAGIFKKNATIGLSVGAWAGGNSEEIPCLDNYDREFQCFSLLPWVDRVQIRTRSRIEFSGALQINTRY